MILNKNIVNNISLYLRELDLTNFGLICKILSKTILQKCKLKILLKLIPKSIVFLTYNKNNQVISSCCVNQFNISEYLNRYKFIKNIIIVMYTKINEDYKFYYNEEIIEDFSKIPKMNFCDENFSKIIFYFKRNCETYEIFNMQDAYQVKHIGCGNIQNSNYFSKSYKLDYGTKYWKQMFDGIKGINYYLDEFCPENLIEPSFKKIGNKIYSDTYSFNSTELLEQNYILKGVEYEYCGVENITFLWDKAEILVLKDFSVRTSNFKYKFLKELKTLYCFDICDKNVKELKNLKHLKKISLVSYEPTFILLSKQITHLKLRSSIKNIFDIHSFINLEYLNIILKNKTIDLTKHYNLVHVVIKANNSKIIFNQNIKYDCIDIVINGNTRFNVFKTNILVFDTHISKSLINNELKECIVNKLILNSENTKILKFPRNLYEIKLYSTYNYTFSDFPDSIEKIFVNYYNIFKTGSFPANLRELTVQKILFSRNSCHGFFKAQHLSKFITSIETPKIFFPIGNIDFTYINKQGMRCICYKNN